MTDAKDGFDEAAAGQAASELYKSDDSHQAMCARFVFVDGARWQWGRDKRRIEYYKNGNDLYRSLVAERDNWRDEYMHVREFATHYEAERDVLKAEVAKLREALENVVMYSGEQDVIDAANEALKAAGEGGAK